MSDIEIKCPCCKAKISVSRETGQVLHFEEQKKGPEDFTNFLDRQKSRSQDLARKFDQAKEKGKSRLAAINEKIEWKKQHLDDSDPRPRMED
jgi:hypothetical protein